jgi:small subunit ribosomal protein S16
VVRIRLRRVGAKKKPFYRVVVADQRSPRDGRFIEAIGTYDPHPDPAAVTIDVARAAHWVTVGARPSESVARLLRQQNIIDENGNVIATATEAQAEPSAETGAVGTEDEESETEESATEETDEEAATAEA